ncbi:unnamed protein product [Soboliphyme baturini]|uniref:DUF775 domain-containing protein n=1 Tax=Soboliphyme baturini TaxID=241478 RepID=A0A183J395_9BILA|nr:unnamed protein product [Soboliphyme baturini]
MLGFGQPSHLAQIGISVEPLHMFMSMTPASGTTPQLVDSFTQFSQKMLENFCNFASSFAVSASSGTLNPSESYVPMSCVQKWYENFVRRMSLDPNFWRT